MGATRRMTLTLPEDLVQQVFGFRDSRGKNPGVTPFVAAAIRNALLVAAPAAPAAKPDSLVLDPVGNVVDAARQMVQTIYGHLDLAAIRLREIARADDVRYTLLKDEVAALGADLAGLRSTAEELAARLTRALERRPRTFAPLLDATETLDELVQDFEGYPDLVKASDAVWRIAREWAGQDLSEIPIAEEDESDAPATELDGRVGGE